MSFYVLLSCVLIILTLFTVGESFLKNCNINKYFFIVVIGGCLALSYIKPLFLNKVNVSYSYIFLFLVFAYSIFKIRVLKDYFKIVLIIFTCTTIGVIYNAVNWLGYEYLFIAPYVYVSVVLGVFCFIFSKNIYVCYAGSFLGITICELIGKKADIQLNPETFILGDTKFLLVLMVLIISFVVISQFWFMLKFLKHKKSTKKYLNQN